MCGCEKCESCEPDENIRNFWNGPNGARKAIEDKLLTALKIEMEANFEHYQIGTSWCPGMDWDNNKYKIMEKTYELRLVEVEQVEENVRQDLVVNCKRNNVNQDCLSVHRV